ncbi:MAG TPA: efflux RND transporter periplasmic adaptor subunit [Ignavibacteriales bacterium]|nr:efflux RND transporter periplasmic adaptor subunit [Ignavibacteriales bacterium]
MKTTLLIGALSFGLFVLGCGNGNDKNTIEASGTIEATNVTVSSKVAGQVQKIYKDEGDNVKAGDTLLTVDHDLLSIQLNQALAGRDFAEAQLKLLRKGARSEDISQAEENTRQAQINLDMAQRDKDRMTKLYEQKSITKKQYEDAMAKYQLTGAQYNAAKDNLKKMKNFARPEEIRQAEANLGKAEASVELLKKNIQDSYVTSPMNGILVKKFVEAGETVGPNSSLFRISDLKVVDLVIYVSEEELGRVKLGQKAEVSVDAFKNKTFEGKVIYISPEAEFTPKNIQTKDERTKLVFAVKIEILNPNFDLKAGMPADAVIKY